MAQGASRPGSGPGGLGWRCCAVRLLTARVRGLAALPSWSLENRGTRLGLPLTPTDPGTPPSVWRPVCSPTAPAPMALTQQGGFLPTWALAPGPRTTILPRPGDWAPSGRPCRTWTCFSRIRRLLKVRFPSVQYLEGESGHVGAKGTAQGPHRWLRGGAHQGTGRAQPSVHSAKRQVERYLGGGSHLLGRKRKG